MAALDEALVAVAATFQPNAAPPEFNGLLQRGLRRRRRRIAAAGAAVAAVAAVAVSVGANLIATSPTQVLRPTASAPPTSSPGPSQSPARPRYLPPGVTVLSGPEAAPGNGQDVGRTVYSVAHEAADVRSGWTLELVTRPGDRVEVLPADAASETEVLRRAVTYYVTRPRSGFGTYRLDWTDGRFVYSLMEDRLKLPDGPSGIPLNELERMAFSTA